MNVIPVIDLMQGQVVRAVRGDRRHYRPIASALCASSEPLTVARILCEHVAARQLYVADLDALQGGSSQVAVVRQLLDALPGIELWLDAGFSEVSQAHALRAGLGRWAERLVPVFGSESLPTRAAFEACFPPAVAANDTPQADHAILSLDRRDHQRLDPAGCWESPASWPARVIVMTLERVGAGTGPDLATLREVAACSPHTRFIGAGGITSEADLALAQEAGASDWLVASALHDLHLSRRS